MSVDPPNKSAVTQASASEPLPPPKEPGVVLEKREQPLSSLMEELTSEAGPAPGPSAEVEAVVQEDDRRYLGPLAKVEVAYDDEEAESAGEVLGEEEGFDEEEEEEWEVEGALGRAPVFIKCPECQVVLTSVAGYNKHMRREHPDSQHVGFPTIFEKNISIYSSIFVPFRRG